MKMVKVYLPIEELSKYIQKNIPEEDQKFAEDCTWVPIRMELAHDMTIEATVVAAKNGETEDRRYRIWET